MYNSTNAATWLNSPPCIARRRNSTLRFVCLFIAATWLRSPPRIARRRNSTLRFVYYFATSRYFSQPNAAWRFSTQRFVCQFIIASRRRAAHCNELRLGSSHFNSTQRFVCQFIAAPPRVSAHRSTSQRDSPQRLTLLHHVALGNATN